MVSGNKPLTHWGWVTHICVGELPIIGSDNGLSPGRCQAIIWTNAGILLIRTLGINFSEILSEIHTFSFKKMHLKMSGKRRPFCLGLDVLTESMLTKAMMLSLRSQWVNGHIRLSISTVNRTYELSGITHVTPFRKYGKHSTGPSTYGTWVRTYSKFFSCNSVLTVCS